MLAELEVFKRALMGVFPLHDDFFSVLYARQTNSFGKRLSSHWLTLSRGLIQCYPNVIAIIPPHFIQFGLLLCPKAVLPNLLTADCDVEHRLLIWPTEVLSQLNLAVNIPSATCCTSQLMASSKFSVIIRLLWQKWRRWWSNKRVNLDRTNQPCNLLGWFLHCLAHHPGTFSIVWPLTELLFFSLVSPRDPKWDIDILARPVLGLAFDAPECSA